MCGIIKFGCMTKIVRRQYRRRIEVVCGEDYDTRTFHSLTLSMAIVHLACLCGLYTIIIL